MAMASRNPVAGLLPTRPDRDPRMIARSGENPPVRRSMSTVEWRNGMVVTLRQPI